PRGPGAAAAGPGGGAGGAGHGGRDGAALPRLRAGGPAALRQPLPAAHRGGRVARGGRGDRLRGAEPRGGHPHGLPGLRGRGAPAGGALRLSRVRHGYRPLRAEAEGAVAAQQAEAVGVVHGGGPPGAGWSPPPPFPRAARPPPVPGGGRRGGVAAGGPARPRGGGAGAAADCRDRLRRAGWSLGEAAAGAAWVVDGPNGENILLAVAATQEEAWRRAGEQ